jgi:hypothetical protein
MIKVKLTTFRQNPPRGGKPARLSRRREIILRCVGDRVLRVEIVLGDKVWLFIRIRSNGATIIMYVSKYPIAAGVDIMERASIHPIWEIEENASKGRSWVCARPLMAPIKLLITLRNIIGNIRVSGKLRLNKRNRGVSFCQVKRVEAAGQLSAAIVEGNHWCIGAIPAFVIRAIKRSIGLRLFQGVSHVVGPRRNRIEPVA